MTRSGFNALHARITLVAFVLLLAALLVVLILEIYRTVILVRSIDANSTRTQGIVLAVDTGPNKHNDWRLTVAYKDNYGIEHRFYPAIWVHWFNHPDKGDSVTVVYHKDNPRMAFLDGFLDRWAYTLKNILLALGLIGVIVFLGRQALFGSVDSLKSLTGYWDTLGKK